MSAIVGKNYEKPTLDLNFAENKSLIDSHTGRNLITFSRSQSGKEATYVGSDGLIKYAGADEPRFDHNPTISESLGLLIEEQRTNLFNSSNFRGSWGLFNSATIKYNAELSPDGTRSAIELTTYPGWESGLQYNCSGSNDTVSVFVKKGTMDYVQIFDNSSNMYCTVNLITGTIGGGYVLNCTASIIPYPNGWYRVIVANASWGNYIKIGYHAGITNGGTVYLWGSQLEEGTFPTSYIPTSGSTKTRNADEASITGSNFSSWYNQSEGTIFANFRQYANQGGWRGIYASSVQGSYPALQTNSSGGSAEAWMQTYSASTKIDFAIAQGSPHKTAIAHKGGVGIFGSIDGGSIISKSYTSNQTGATNVNFYNGYYGERNNGHMARFTYWPKRLPDLELQQLTK
jgi:hypothetical protein